MELVKKIATILLTGAVALGVIIGAVSWFQMSPDDRSAMIATVGRALAWLGIVLVLPWATYFITTWVARRESNAAGAVLVVGYTLIDAAVLFYLIPFSQFSAIVIALICLGILIALLYNLLTCDWIAEKVG